MKALKKLWNAITEPFAGLIAQIGTSMELNEDGAWGSYWERKNRREMKKGGRK